MSLFNARFPELGPKETRSASVQGRPGLPDGEYGFIELYCDEAHCDCRRVMINVYSRATAPRILATINYGWESVEFYRKWLTNKQNAQYCVGASLDPINPQTAYAPALLDLFEFVLEDPVYVERLKRHYRLFKGAVANRQRAKQPGKPQSKRDKRRKR